MNNEIQISLCDETIYVCVSETDTNESLATKIIEKLKDGIVFHDCEVFNIHRLGNILDGSLVMKKEVMRLVKLAENTAKGQMKRAEINGEAFDLNKAYLDNLDEFLGKLCAESQFYGSGASFDSKIQFYEMKSQEILTRLCSKIFEACDDADIDFCLDIDDDIEDILNPLLSELLEQSDKTTPKDLFAHYGSRFELQFNPFFDLDSVSAEDETFSLKYKSNVSSDLDTAMSDKPLAYLMALANIKIEDFVNQADRDLTEEEKEYLLNISEYSLNQGSKQLINTKGMIELLRNAGYGGLPIWFGYMDAYQFIFRDLTKPCRIQRGAIALFDVVWGSGHDQNIKSMVVPEINGWKACFGKDDSYMDKFGCAAYFYRSELDTVSDLSQLAA